MNLEYFLTMGLILLSVFAPLIIEYFHNKKKEVRSCQSQIQK